MIKMIFGVNSLLYYEVVSYTNTYQNQLVIIYKQGMLKVYLCYILEKIKIIIRESRKKLPNGKLVKIYFDLVLLYKIL